MMDRLTVMGCLEGLTQDDWEQWYSDSEVQETAKAALSLLKDREAVEPNVIIDTLVCGNCGTRLERQSMVGDNILFTERFDYCPSCGRKVKLE